MVSLVDGTDAAQLTAAELQAMGFVLALYAVTTLFAAARAAADALAALRRDGAPVLAAERRMAYADFTALVGLPAHQRLDESFGSG